MKKIFFVVFGIVSMLFASCTSSVDDENESIWDGLVQPGTYTGHFHDENGRAQFGTPELDYNYVLTIHDDESIELREECKNCYNGSVDVKLFYGYIEKHTENYDGELKVWYGIEGRTEGNSCYATSHNLSLDLVMTNGNCHTWQEYDPNWYRCQLHKK